MVVMNRQAGLCKVIYSLNFQIQSPRISPLEFAKFDANYIAKL